MRVLLLLAAVGILAGPFASGQALSAAENIPAARQALIPRARERNLRCAVEPILPALLYTVPEIAAGYTYSVPLAQYANGRPEHGWDVTAGFRVVGGLGAETYLSGHIGATAPAQDTSAGNASYWIGPGSYSVNVAISDNTGRVCRKDWTVTVRTGPAPGPGMLRTIPEGGVFGPEFDYRTLALVSRLNLRLGTAPGTVRVPPRRGDLPVGGQLPAKRIAILLDAPSDAGGQLAILDALETLLARIPAGSVRLAAFSLKEGHEFFRRNGFKSEALGELREAFTSLQFRAVSVAELQNHPILTPAQLLDSLLQREMREPERSEAVLFLGMERGMESSTFHFSTIPERPLPRFSYVHLVTPAGLPMMFPGSGPSPGYNLIPWIVRKLDGKTMNVNFNKDFDQAVEKLQKTIPTPALRTDNPPRVP